MANRFWVGGNANWDATAGTKWATSTGGAGGAAVPTAADDVFLDNGTGTGNVTIPSATTVVCRSLNCTGYIKILTFAATTSVISIGDGTAGASSIALKLVSGMTLTLTGIGTINFLSTSVTQQTVDSGTLTMPNMTFNGAAGTWKLNSNHTLGTGTTLTLTAGALDINGKAVSVGLFSSTGASTRSMQDALGGGTFAVTGNAGTIWTTSNATGLTLNSNLPTISFSYAGATGTRTITGSNTAEASTNIVSCSFGAGTDTVSMTGSWKTINHSGLGAATISNNSLKIYGALTLGASPTYSTGGQTLTFAATSGTNIITSNGKSIDYSITINGSGGTFQLADNLTINGTGSRTLNLTTGTLDLNGKTLSCGIYSDTGTATRGLTFGAGVLTVSGNNTTVFNLANNTGLTVSPGTGYVQLTYAGATGTRTIQISVASANVFDFKITAGTDTIATTGGFTTRDMNFTGFAGTFAGGNGINIYGSLTIASGMTITANGNGWNMWATSGTKTITTNGVTINSPFGIFGAGGTFQLQDNMTIGSAYYFTLSDGTLDLNGKVLTADSFNSNSNNNVRAITVSGGSITLTGSGETIWAANSCSNFSLSANLVVTCNYSGSVGARIIDHGSGDTGYTQANSPSFNITAGSDTFQMTSCGVFNLNFTGFTGTFSISNGNQMYVFGSLTFVSGMTLSLSGGLNMQGTGTQNLTSGGKTIAMNITLSNGGGTLSLQDNLTTDTGYTLSVYKGTLTTNNKNMVVSNILLGGDSGIVANLGSSTITLDQSWQIGGAISTINAGTSIIILSAGANSTGTFYGGGFTYYEVRFTDLCNVSQGGNFTNIKVLKSALVRGYTRISSGPYVISGTLTMTDGDLASNSNTDQIIIRAAAVSLTRAGFQNIIAQGAAIPFTGTNISDLGNNQNITVTPAVTRYWVGNGGNWYDATHWSATSGGAGGASIPLAQDTAIFNANSFSIASQIVYLNIIFLSKMNWSGVTNLPTMDFRGLGSQQTNFMGDVTFTTGMVITDTQNDGINFVNFYDCTFNTGGLVIPINCFFFGFGGTVSLASDLITTKVFDFSPTSNCSFDAKNFNVTCDNFGCFTGDATNHLYMGNGTWTITGNDSGYEGGFYLNQPISFHCQGSTIKFTDTTSNQKTFYGGGNTFNNVWIAGGGTGIYLINYDNTFNVFKVDATPCTIQFSAGHNQSARQFSFKGSSGNLVTISSDNPGTSFELTQTGGVVKGNYLSIRDCLAIGGANFYAGNSTNVSGNSGWIFKPAPNFVSASI